MKEIGKDDGLGFFEIKLGKRGVKLSGWKGLLVLAGGCLALKLAFGLASDAIHGNSDQVPTEPTPVSAPAPR